MKTSAKFLPKRWIVFGFVWLLIFAVAPLRYLTLIEMQQTFWPLSALAGAGKERSSFSELLKEYPGDVRVWSAAADEENSAPVSFDEASAPLNASLAASPFFPGKPHKDFRTEQRRRLDFVIEKFPDHPWLIAKRLKSSWGYMYGDRLAGELSDANLPANKAAGIASPERRKYNSGAGEANTYPNYKPQEVQGVLQLCARGQKLEPNNAYYDWTRAYFLALSWRDKEAWQALDAAAQKPVFDDHQLEDVRARMDAIELRAHRPLLWEEKLTISYWILFPQFARYREFARIVSWESIEAQRRGDHAQALRLMGSLAKVSAKIRDNSKFIIERLVANAMEQIAISSATYDARNAVRPRGTTAQQNATRLGGATAYATAHGRRDLANWLSQDAVKATSTGGAVALSNIIGTSFRNGIFIVLLRVLGTLILTTLPLCLVARFAAYWILKIPRVQNLLQNKTPILFQNEKIAPRDIVSATLASGGFNLIVAAALGVLVVGSTIVLGAISFGKFAELKTEWDNFWSATQGTPGVSNSIWESLFYKLMEGDYDVGTSGMLNPFAGDLYLAGAHWALALLPLGFGALWCARVALARQRGWQKISAGETAHSQNRGALSTLRMFIQEHTAPPEKAARLQAEPQSNFDGTAFFMHALRGAATGIFWALWLLTSFWPARNEALSFYGPLLIGAALGAALWFDIFRQWIVRRADFNHRRRATRFGLRLMRESWLGWLAMGSIAFLLTLLLAMPLRSRADIQVTRYLTLGEIAMMK